MLVFFFLSFMILKVFLDIFLGMSLMLILVLLGKLGFFFEFEDVVFINSFNYFYIFINWMCFFFFKNIFVFKNFKIFLLFFFFMFGGCFWFW